MTCGNVVVRETNHFGKIYPQCYVCVRVRTMECLEDKPPEWADLFKVRQKLINKKPVINGKRR